MVNKLKGWVSFFSPCWAEGNRDEPLWVVVLGVLAKSPKPPDGLEDVFAGGAPAGVVELRENMGFAGVAWAADGVLELVPPKREPPVVAPPPPNIPPGLLVEVS